MADDDSVTAAIAAQNALCYVECLESTKVEIHSNADNTVFC